MADSEPAIKTTVDLPESVSAESKKRIHERLKALVEQEFANESQTLGTLPGRPAIHAFIGWEKAEKQ